MKVFTRNQFIDKLKWLVNDVPNYYYSAIDSYCNYNWNIGKFMMDCVVSIKGLLWGFRADPNAPHGGAQAGANGVADFTPSGGLDYCDNVSGDFSNIEAGEYLCMAGTGYEHAGVYLGNGKVFECTVGWGVNRCIISDIDKAGNRSLNGQPNLRWTRHGKLRYIDYSDTPAPTPTGKHNVGDVVNINGVYVSSDSTDKLVPAITTGTITRIVEGARNPYLLDNGNIGWVNDGCIIEDTPTPTPAPTPAPSVDILDLVRRTIRGDFGNGQDRVNALGENYAEVQHQVDLNYANGTTNWDNVRLY